MLEQYNDTIIIKYSEEAPEIIFSPLSDITPLESVRFSQMFALISVQGSMFGANLKKFIEKYELQRHFKEQ